MSKSIATAADVRSWFVSHPKSLARLSEGARSTVVREGEAASSLRGRLAPEAIAAFNKGQRKAEYVTGNSKQVTAAAKEQAAALRESARAAGIAVGKRGPLPKAVLAASKG